ncbi:DUF1156 domain-containing protein [Methanobacterium sp. YSL]|nr:DUF1156 domain-containing protein [Methanobacterium sp. YSL]
MDRRFIEDSFPVKEISEESAKERNIRHGHISTLHIWWARRPLTSSRATNYASLIPAATNNEDLKKKREFIIELSKWKNSFNDELLDSAKQDILSFYDGESPLILDPFSGGGSIPLEALRLGCETYANDYNPVAVLIEKCSLDYPQRYGEKLITDVEKWASWVLQEAEKDIGKFYPIEKVEKEEFFGLSQYNLLPIGYIWAKTLDCQNPSCGINIPLFRQFWLSKNNNVSLHPIYKENEIKFEIVGKGYNDFPIDFDPTKGTIMDSVVTCPICNTPIEASKTRDLFKSGKSKDRLIATVSMISGRKGKIYNTNVNIPVDAFKDAEKTLFKKRKDLKNDWGLDPVPSESIDVNSEETRILNYGIDKWELIFNSRQKLALITFAEKIRNAHMLMSEEYSADYSKAVTSYLGLALDRLADRCSRLSRYHAKRETIENVFSRHSFSMVWDYIESNIFSGVTGSWDSSLDWITRFLKHSTKLASSAVITQSSATKLPYPDNYFDAIFTDPPYYDNVNYAELSDFFYVWLKRSIGHLYPDLFLTPSTPKNQEIVANPKRQGGAIQAMEFFESMLSESLEEIYRVLKPNGISTIVYAHKTTRGWETVINAILNSGLTVTASWPLSTEMKSSLHSRKTASLSSSIYIVARKTDKNDIGWFNEVKMEINNHIPQKLDKLWEEGIYGADFFVAAIGSAIEIFGKYKKILDFEGNEIRADKLLSYVRNVVTDYAMKQILHNGIAGELSPLTKFYLLWRWNYQDSQVNFDESRKLAQSAGIDLSSEWNKGFILKKGKYIQVLGPDKREKKDLNESIELIDTLHSVCILWKNGKNEEMRELLENSGWGSNETFYKVAQAISETLPISNSEKKLIDGFLAGKDMMKKDLSDECQSKLV